MMIRAKSPLIPVMAGILALAACDDQRVYESGERTRTGDGALIGAAIGAVLGGTHEGRDRLKNAAIGAAIGAGAGAVIGDALDRQAAELRRNFGDERISVVNTGSALIVTMPQDILFETDSARVRPGLQGDLRVLATSLRGYPDTTVDVIGHTDNTGGAAYNQRLSTRRADAVAIVLLRAGVGRARVRAYGLGEDDPVASNLTPEDRARNRRVEIMIHPSA